MYDVLLTRMRMLKIQWIHSQRVYQCISIANPATNLDLTCACNLHTIAYILQQTIVINMC